MSKIKVGIVTKTIDVSPSGPSIYLENLCEDLLKLEDEEVELYFIHHEKNDHLIYEKGNEILCSSTPIAFMRCIAKQDLDVIHYNCPTFKRFLFYFLPFLKIVTLHGDAVFVMPQSYVKRQGRWLEKIGTKMLKWVKLINKVDQFISVSDSVARSLEEHLGINRNKIKTIYHGIDNCFKPLEKKQAKKKAKSYWGLSSSFILDVNNNDLKKNITTLIRAFHEVKQGKENEDLELVIVGAGYKKDKNLNQLISDLNLQEDIRFLGFVEPEKLSILYNSAEVFVNPTLHETFGMSNLEAMGCGCPVITSDRFAVPEVVGDAAVLLDDPEEEDEIAEEINELLNNPRKRKNLSERGIKKAKKFSWEKCAKETLQVYKSTAKGK